MSGTVDEHGKYPKLDDSSYGERPIRFTDTGEEGRIATIGGEPVGLPPSGAAVDHWLLERRLRAVSEEYVRDHARRDHRDRCWESFTDRRLLGRLLSALWPGREPRL